MFDSLVKSVCDVLPIYAWSIVLPIYYADDKAENGITGKNFTNWWNPIRQVIYINKE